MGIGFVNLKKKIEKLNFNFRKFNNKHETVLKSNLQFSIDFD